MGSEIPHFTNQRITVSFSRREVSCHAVPTHFVKSTRRSPAVTFPVINCSGFVDKCSVASLSTLFLNSALNVTSSGWTLLVAPGGTSPSVVLQSCVRMVFTLSVVWAIDLRYFITVLLSLHVRIYHCCLLFMKHNLYMWNANKMLFFFHFMFV